MCWLCTCLWPAGAARAGGFETPASLAGTHALDLGHDRDEMLALQDWFGRPPVERRRAWQERKNPVLAMLASFLVPGLGQLYNERPFWAAVAAGVHIGFAGDIVIQARLANRYRALKNEPIPEGLSPADLEIAEQEREAATVRFLLHRDNRLQSTWLLGLTMLLSGLQAFVDAHLFDFDENVPLQLQPSWGDVHGGALLWHF